MSGPTGPVSGLQVSPPATGPAGEDGTALNSGDAISVKSVMIADTDVFMHADNSMANGAAAQVGTLTNAPTAGNPTKWLAFDDNGTTRYIPAW